VAGIFQLFKAKRVFHSGLISETLQKIGAGSKSLSLSNNREKNDRANSRDFHFINEDHGHGLMTIRTNFFLILLPAQFHQPITHDAFTAEPNYLSYRKEFVFLRCRQPPGLSHEVEIHYRGYFALQ
jgi:hypothetical protein